MMFITFGGLSIYDGINFNNYNQQDGLANDLVNDIFEITPDSFLIATNTSFLNTLVRGKIGQFETSDHFYPVINKFLKTKDGSMLVIADDGLYRMEKNRFIRIPLLDHDGIELGRNLAWITEWKNYLLMIPWNRSQKEKLIFYDKEAQKVVASITDKVILSAAASINGDLWLTSPDGIETPDLASLENGKIKLIPLPFTKKPGNWKNAYVYFDDAGDAWIYQNNEVLHMDSSGKQQLYSPAQGLKTSNISDIFVDRERITWMASDGNGVVKLPGTNVRILSDLIPGTRNNISAIHQQSDTTWVFNLTDNSFYRIHQQTITSFRLGGEPKNVGQIFVGGDKLYFVTALNLWVVQHKDQAASYQHPLKIFSDTAEIIELGIGIPDPHGNIILSLQQNQANFYLVVIHDQRVLMKMRVSYSTDQMVIDKSGYLWVPTRDIHLLTYSFNPDQPDQYLQLVADHSKEITGTSPRSIAVDTHKNIWLGTRFNGIYRFSQAEKELQTSFQLTTVQGLTDNFHYQLYCDVQNNIWAGSQAGLDKIYFKNGKYVIENITKSKNIFQGIFRIINVEDDVIWAMTSNGNIIRVSNDMAGKILPNPSFFITAIFVNDKEYKERATVFSHEQNNFSINVAAPSFIDEKSILYSYRLQGSGKNDWSKPSNIAQFNFINLAAGGYILSIKAEFPASIYPEQQLEYAFTIRPPFWETFWFISLAILAMLSLFGLFVRFYYNRKLEKQRMILEKKQAIEKERTRIATDMHDDLGAGLSRIKFLSETIGFKKQLHQPIEDEINNIREYSHEMIDKMGEIVWALNEKNDSLSDLLSYTRAYAVEYLAENGVQTKIDKLPHLIPRMVNGEFRRNIYLSVKEALHNIIKHARANHVSIHFNITKDLVIEIRDDGVGFDPVHLRPYSNGLSNMKKRMTEIGGHMEIRHNQGTCVILTAPLPS